MKLLVLFITFGLFLHSVTTEEEEKSDKKEETGTVIGIDLGTTYSW